MVMKRTLIPVVLAIVALSLSGCGTVCNFAAAVRPPQKDPDGWPRVYGGLQFDALVVDNSHWPGTTNTASEQAGENADRGKYLGLGLLIGAALTEGVASLVADTLTLPITVPIGMVRHSENGEKPKEPAAQVIHEGQPQYSINGPRGGDVPTPAETDRP